MAEISSINILAQNAYNQAQNRPKITDKQDLEMQKAVTFQNMVKQGFNSFAKMSSQQILQHIQNAKLVTHTAKYSSKISPHSGGIMEGVVSSLKNSLHKHEDMVKKSLLNEATLIEVTTATTEAANAMKLASAARDKFLDAFNRVMNMSV